MTALKDKAPFAVSEAYERALAKTAEEHQPLFIGLYSVMKEVVGDRSMEESIKWGQLMFHRGTENLISLIPLKARINLQFHNGAHLDNAQGLLEGTGKDLRHVKCHNLAFLDLHRAELAKLIDESIEAGA